jgi:hypothetical protein
MLNDIVNMQFYATGKRPKLIGLCSGDFPAYIC